MRFLILALFLCLTFLPAEGQTPRTLDRTLAKVNEEIITESDLVSEVSQRTNVPVISPAEAWQHVTPAIAQSLVDRSLLMQTARKERLVLPDTELNEEVESMVRDLRSKFSSEKEFRATLAEEEMSVEDLKEKILKKVRDDFRIHALINRRYETGRTAQSEKSTSGSIHLIRLGASVNKHGGKEGACKRARQMAAETIGSGLSFEEGIRKYSEIPGTAQDGGDMGWLSMDQLSSEVQTAVANLEVGHATAPIIAGDFANIFYIAGKRTGRGEAVQSRFMEARAALLADLTRKMTIHIYDERFKKLLDITPATAQTPMASRSNNGGVR